MVHLCPEQRIRDQEILHLRPAIIIDQRAPVRMTAFARVQVLIQAGAVESRQSKGIPWKMSRHPVQNHADSLTVHIIHKIHEILRRTIPGCRRVIASHLISPGLIQGMLHNRHQLHMGISHILHVFRKHWSDLPVVVELPDLLGRFFRRIPILRRIRPVSVCRRQRRIRAVLFCLRLPPGAQMHFIDKKRLFLVIRLLSLFQPGSIRPFEAGQIRDNRSRIGAELSSVRIGVRLQHGKTAFRLNLIFIAGAGPDSRNKELKNACLLNPPHGMPAAIPEVEISHYAHTARIGRPHGKISTFYPLDGHGMRSHLFIQRIMNSRLELVQVLIRIHLRLKTVGVFQLLNRPVVILSPEQILGDRLSGKQRREKAAFIRQLHLVFLSRTLDHRGHLHRCRQKSLNQDSILHFMGSKNLLGLVLLRVDQRLNTRPVHQFIQPVIHTLLLLIRPGDSGTGAPFLEKLPPYRPFRSVRTFQAPGPRRPPRFLPSCISQSEEPLPRHCP